MSWKNTVFERDKLYAEVWAEPMTILANRYGISDVGLRKICKRLAVPMPTAGHWAKKRAGKPVHTIPLSKWSGDTTYTSTRWVDEDAAKQHDANADEPEEVVRQRAIEALPENTVSFNDDLEQYHRYAKATAKRMEKPYPVIKGLISPHGSPSLLVTVSAGQVPRAMRLMDAILRTAEARGFKVASKARHDLPQAHRDVVIEVLDESMYLSLTERVRQTERELTPDEIKQKKVDSHYWISDRWIYEPVGVFKLAVSLEFRGAVRERFADKTGSPLENQIHDIMVTLVAIAIARKRARVAAEEHKRQAAIDEAERYRQRVQREKSLKVLHSIEGLAERWERAQRLRAFASALESSADRLPSNDVEHRAAQVSWIRKRADWLDPLTHREWEEVDVEGHYWHHDDWMTKYTTLERTTVDDLLVRSEAERQY